MKFFKAIKNKYLGLALPLKATIWFAFSQILLKGINILTTPFFTRLLSTEQYGQLSTFISWENIFSILIMFSTYKGLMNLCVKYDDHNKILSGVTGLNLTIASIWVVVFVIFRNQLSELMGLSVLLVLFLLVLCIYQNIFTSWIVICQYNYKYKRIVFVTVLYSFMSAVGGIIFVVFINKSAEVKLFPQVVCAIIIGIILLIIIFKNGKVFFVKEYWKFALMFCIPLLPHYLSEVILQSSDRIMINQMCGESDVAIYSVAYMVGSAISLVTGAINSAFAPYQYQKIKNEEYDVLAKNTNYIIAFIALCICLIMLFGKEIVLILGGQQYISSVNLIIPICLGCFFNYVFQLFARVQEYYEQKYTIVIASVSCAVLNICLNYVCIKKFGFETAAYTTFICYFIFCFLHYLFYMMVCKKHIKRGVYDIKCLSLISVILLAASVVIWFIKDIFYIKYILLAVLLIVLIWKRKKIVKFIKSKLLSKEISTQGEKKEDENNCT